MRSNLLTQREKINTMQQEIDTLRKEGTRFDDIVRKGYQDLQLLRERQSQPTAYGGGVSALDPMTADPRSSHRTFATGGDPRMTQSRWGDAEVDQTLANLSKQEQELLRILSNVPEDSAMYRTKAKKLEELTRQRIELEKMLYNRADYQQYYSEKVIEDSKRDNLAQWLRRDLKLFESKRRS